MQLWKSVHRRDTESPRHENPRTSRRLPPLQTGEICCRRTRLEHWPLSRLGDSGDHLKEDGAIGEGGNPHPANTKGVTTQPRQGLEPWNTMLMMMSSGREARNQEQSVEREAQDPAALEMDS